MLRRVDGPVAQRGDRETADLRVGGDRHGPQFLEGPFRGGLDLVHAETPVHDPGEQVIHGAQTNSAQCQETEKGPADNGGALSNICPAVSYSPTRSPMQYHRR
ncbi:hypothetical protein GCM10010402_78520 [Actinomadura luteofluorescens]